MEGLAWALSENHLFHKFIEQRISAEHVFLEVTQFVLPLLLLQQKTPLNLPRNFFKYETILKKEKFTLPCIFLFFRQILHIQDYGLLNSLDHLFFVVSFCFCIHFERCDRKFSIWQFLFLGVLIVLLWVYLTFFLTLPVSTDSVPPNIFWLYHVTVYGLPLASLYYTGSSGMGVFLTFLMWVDEITQ